MLICVVVVLLLWAVGFYYAMMDEITDEVDDSLEDYSEMIIIRSLAGDSLPSANIGSNNQYFIKEISPAYAMSRQRKRQSLPGCLPQYSKTALTGIMSWRYQFLQ